MEATGGQMTLFSQVASHNYANRTAAQENDLGKKMNAIYGRKCSEQLKKFNHVGLWAKTFTDLLIGQEGWYSTKCKLTWKLKGTKYSRIYCQLFPSTLPIEGIEFGLLPTVTAQDFKRRGPNSQQQGLPEAAYNGLLPTSTAMDNTQATSNMKLTQVKEEIMHSMTLSKAMSIGMLPTPRTRDWKGCEGRRGDIASFIQDNLKLGTGKPSQLNPRFVLEMMGFPTDWTELPFLSGDKNQSKEQGMQ